MHIQTLVDWIVHPRSWRLRRTVRVARRQFPHWFD